jgi:Flp pilus assembly pilin Flp
MVADEEGAPAVELNLMVGLITVVIAVAVGSSGVGVERLFQSLLDVWPS